MKALEYMCAGIVATFFAMLLFSGSAAEQVVGIDKLANVLEQINK